MSKTTFNVLDVPDEMVSWIVSNIEHIERSSYDNGGPEIITIHLHNKPINVVGRRPTGYIVFKEGHQNEALVFQLKFSDYIL